MAKQDPMPWGPGVTTVMIRQVPRTFTQRQLLEEASARGFGDVLDFAYLPFDLRKGARRCGYGFLNFIAAEYAVAFRDSFDGTYIDRRSREKGRPLRVHPAEVQGYEANHEHFSNTRVGQRNDPEFGPLFFYHLSDRQKAQSEVAAPGDALLAGRTLVPAKEPTAGGHRKGLCKRRGGGSQDGKIRGEDDRAGAEAPTSESSSRQNFCVCCGLRLKPLFNFCANCGMGLEESKANVLQAPLQDLQPGPPQLQEVLQFQQ